MHAWIPLLVALALAGCVAPAATDAPPETDPAASPVAPPASLEGTVWLPPSSGNAREETVLELPANASGLRIHAELVLGSTYGAELPVTTADVVAELRDAEGKVLAEGTLGTRSRELVLEAVTTFEGAHTLALLSYGGSDGSGIGDHVHYHVEVAPEQA